MRPSTLSSLTTLTARLRALHHKLTTLLAHHPSLTHKRPAPPRPQPYYHIPLGSGGVLSTSRFNRRVWNTAYLGATACVDSVGVFFEIEDDLCFAAHVDACVKPHPDRVVEWSPTSSWSGNGKGEEGFGVGAGAGVGHGAGSRSYVVNENTAARLRADVLVRLGLAVPGEKTRRMRETLILTGRRMGNGTVGEVVASAVREFMGVEDGEVGVLGSAFVVRWPEGGEGWIMRDGLVELGWEEMECGLAEGDWKIEILDRDG